MDLDSFADHAPALALPKDGDFLGSLRSSFEDQGKPTAQFVMPGSSLLHCRSMEDNEDSSRNQCVICTEVGRCACDQRRGDTLSGFSDAVHADMLSHDRDQLPRCNGSLSSLYQGLADQQHSRSTASVFPATAALYDPCTANVLFRDPPGATMQNHDCNPFSSDLLLPVSPLAPVHPVETMPSNGKPQGQKKTTKDNDDKKIRSTANGRTIRNLIRATGTQHVYFGRGEPIRNNPGNRRFRRIANQYHLEYKRASTRTLKREIRNKIIEEVKSDGSNFIVVVETKGTVSLKPAEDERIEAKTGRVLLDTPKRRANCWSWADPSTTPEQLAWSDFLNKDGEKLELMFQRPFSKRTEVGVTVREETHRVNVSWMSMHRVDDCVNNINYLVVSRRAPEEDMHGGEPIFVSGECDGRYDPSSSAKASGNRNSAPSGPTTRSSSHRAGRGAGGVQGNLYCSLGMAQQSKDASLVLSFKAVHEDILEEITSGLKEERADQDRSSPRPSVSISEQDPVSAHPSPCRPTDSRTCGVRRRWLVNRFCMNMVVGFGSHINVCFGRKKAPTEKATQHEAIWLWRESKSRMSRHSSNAIVGDPKDCWVRYDEERTAVLEDSYQVQKGTGECSPNSKYTVNFDLMRQINVSTRFQREVRRLESFNAPKRQGDSTKRAIFDIARKLDKMGVDESDDMTAPTTSADTTMCLDGTLTFYQHPNIV